MSYVAPFTERESLSFFPYTIYYSGCMAHHKKLSGGGIYVEVGVRKWLIGAVALTDYDERANARAVETLFKYQIPSLFKDYKQK